MKEMEQQAKQSLKLQAYQYLKTKILNCEYRPNEFLNEQKLCAEMGNISRTPMRDALGRLEQEGLITILPKKGLMVSGITEEDVHSMFEMRLLVEPYALRNYGNLIPRQALEDYKELMHHPDRIDDFCKSDDDFHALLMSSLPNKYLRSAYDRITGLNTRFRIMTGKVSMIWSWPAIRPKASSRSSGCGKTYPLRRSAPALPEGEPLASRFWSCWMSNVSWNHKIECSAVSIYSIRTNALLSEPLYRCRWS